MAVQDLKNNVFIITGASSRNRPGSGSGIGKVRCPGCPGCAQYRSVGVDCRRSTRNGWRGAGVVPTDVSDKILIEPLILETSARWGKSGWFDLQCRPIHSCVYPGDDYPRFGTLDGSKFLRAYPCGPGSSANYAPPGQRSYYPGSHNGRQERCAPRCTLCFSKMCIKWFWRCGPGRNYGHLGLPSRPCFLEKLIRL